MLKGTELHCLNFVVLSIVAFVTLKEVFTIGTVSGKVSFPYLNSRKCFRQKELQELCKLF